MNQAFKPFALLLVGVAVAGFAAGIAAAQDAPVGSTPPTPTPARTAPVPKSTAQIDAGEPRADTSAPAAATTPAAPPRSEGARRPAAPVPKAASNAADRLSLGTATVTGDREQPKVMYIVPWKRSDMGDLSGKPMNSLLDEALAPVDRDEFRREVAYYGAVNSDASQNGAAKPAAQGEK